MPVTEEQTTMTAAERLKAQSEERRRMSQRTPEEMRNAKDPAHTEPETVVVTREEVLNLPQEIGLSSLDVQLRALPGRLVSELAESFFEKWPTIFYIASFVPLREEDGAIDVEKIADYYTRINVAAARTPDGDTTKTIPEVTIHDVLELLEDALLNIRDWIDGITSSVWLMAEGVNPGMTRDDLKQMILERCTVVDFVRLPRLLLKINSLGGGNIKSLESRFTQP